MSSSKGYPTYNNKPVFIDMLAVDWVVSEHFHLRLTTAEKRHAAHRLAQQGVTYQRIAYILHVTPRTVVRLMEVPPPPALDVDQYGRKALCDH